ncbi:glycoside hydrolase superfamily [Xylariales sp. PMI_506]|nr:glycoside hydrolase superfamily [Xylariales sp. PMI_506]
MQVRGDLSCALARVLLCTAGLARAATWPNGPFVASGRWIADASGDIVTYAGVNWPGHVDTMLPEGLQYQSVAAIVSQIKAMGMNSIRLTYAIEMVDQIEENDGADISIQTAFTNALGQEDGQAIYAKVIANNPSFGSNTTRLDVFDAVAAECANQEIYVHLDNHISQAGWCCSPLDGNSWWGDTYFSTSNWTRGLSYMANHGKQWPNLMSMSLRNELRQPLTNLTLYSDSYNWEDWYTNVRLGADAIHAANPDVLIFLSGINSDTTLTPVVQAGTALAPGTGVFSTDDFSGYSDKLVLELHNYADILGGPDLTNCTALQDDLYTDGFQTLLSNDSDNVNVFPLVLTEWGFDQSNATTWEDTFVTCLEAYLASQSAGFMIWTLSGSYYIREGAQDADDTWGLLTHDWSSFRNQDFVTQGLEPLVAKLVAVNGSAAAATNSTSGGGGGGSGGSGDGSSTSSNDTDSSAPGLTGQKGAGYTTIISSVLLATTIAIFFSV